MGNFRLLFITNYGLHSNGGGVKVYTKNLVGSLDGLGINVELLIREGLPTDKELRLPTNKFLYVASATGELIKRKPKYIVSQGGWFAALPVLFYKFKARDVRAVYIYHTHYDPPHAFSQRLVRAVERLLMTFILSRFDIVLFVSRGLMRNVGENGVLRVSTKWSVLYGAPSVRIPTQTEVEEFTKKFKIDGGKFYLLGHGLTALKVKMEGAKLLMKALKELPDDVYLVLTREGQFVGELKEFVKSLGLFNRVLLTGDLKNPHIATTVTDIYTHITFGEGGLSLALLEVMKIGKPIIASNVGGIPEAIRHPLEGVLVDNNIEDVAGAIKTLVENPKLEKKMSVISQQAVTTRFSWERTAKRLVSMLRLSY